MAEPDDRRRLLRVLLKLGFLGLLAGFGLILLPSLDQGDAGKDMATLRIPLSELAPGQARRYLWQSRPLWVVHRDARILARLGRLEARLLDPDSTQSQQPVWAANPHRGREPAWLVVIGLGTDLGCPVEYLPAGADEFQGQAWPGGFRETCGGSRYDLAGRVFAGQSARRNLRIPEYRLEAGSLIVGD